MQKSARVLKFGPFRIDTQSKLLFCKEERLALPPKAADLLVVLLEREGQLVSKDDLLSLLWPDTFVEESNLSKNIFLLRKTLGDTEDGAAYIETIPKRGYRFTGRVERENSGAVPAVDYEEHYRFLPSVSETRLIAEEHTRSCMIIEEEETAAFPRRTVLLFALVVVLIVAVSMLWIFHKSSSRPEVKSLAVLPLKSFTREAKNDYYLELGLADSIISKVSQIRGLTVRPTSAVRRYAGQDADSLQTARALKVDAVLDGSVQLSGDRIRISVNLLEVRSGSSLWADTFNVPITDIFIVQDEVARKVATSLRFQLSDSDQARLARRQTSSPEAYEYYLRGLYYWDRRGPPDAEGATKSAIGFFRKAIDIDPAYGTARSKLAYAYVWMALFVEPGSAEWPIVARDLLSEAQRRHPDLAELHVVRNELLWSVHEGYQVEQAARELLRAQELDPNVGHSELGILFAHLGLEAQALRELHRALEIDPAGLKNQGVLVEAQANLGRFDDETTLSLRFFGQPGVRALLAQNRLDEVQPGIEAGLANSPNSPPARGRWALLLALRGRFREAEAEAARFESMQKDRSYHHGALDIASVYALEGKVEQSIKWLRKTAETGMPNYVLFARNPHLDRIRKDVAFLQFMEEMKIRWDGFQREFH